MPQITMVEYAGTGIACVHLLLVVALCLHHNAILTMSHTQSLITLFNRSLLLVFSAGHHNVDAESFGNGGAVEEEEEDDDEKQWTSGM